MCLAFGVWNNSKIISSYWLLLHFCKSSPSIFWLKHCSRTPVQLSVILVSDSFNIESPKWNSEMHTLKYSILKPHHKVALFSTTCLSKTTYCLISTFLAEAKIYCYQDSAEKFIYLVIDGDLYWFIYTAFILLIKCCTMAAVKRGQKNFHQELYQLITW